jgi:hypothetical protein
MIWVFNLKGNSLSSGQSNTVQELLTINDDLSKEKNMLNQFILTYQKDIEYQQ